LGKARRAWEKLLIKVAHSDEHDAREEGEDERVFKDEMRGIMIVVVAVGLFFLW
jgi:hypothetical protein